MAKYLIEGGTVLKGTVRIGGNKNAVLPCLAAALLTDKPVTLHNVPDISDVSVMLDLLKYLGVVVERSTDTITVTAEKITTSDLPEELISKLRASILLIGPLLARTGKVTFSYPGGDVIGKRSIHTHLEGMEAMGYHFDPFDQNRSHNGHRTKSPESVDFFLDEASVTATENLIMAAALGTADITLRNCAQEPHVVDLCNLLVAMGSSIEGIGQSNLKIKGGQTLKGAEYSIGPDFTEMGTYAIAAAMTQGEITMTNCTLTNMEPVTRHLERMGIEFKQHSEGIVVSCKSIKPVAKLHTNIWPGFPPDLMSPMIALGTKAHGVSLFHDWMYESRMFFVDKLISMGANITIADPHRVVVYGPTKLYGRNMDTPDIRAGMALMLAALVAKGQSVINRAELIERGYQNVVEQLNSLGANITRLEN